MPRMLLLQVPLPMQQLAIHSREQHLQREALGVETEQKQENKRCKDA